MPKAKAKGKTLPKAPKVKEAAAPTKPTPTPKPKLLPTPKTLPKAKVLKHPAAAAFGETMGTVPPIEGPQGDAGATANLNEEKHETGRVGELPVAETKGETKKDLYTLMLYQSRQIAAIRETTGKKKQVLQAGCKIVQIQ